MRWEPKQPKQSLRKNTVAMCSIETLMLQPDVCFRLQHAAPIHPSPIGPSRSIGYAVRGSALESLAAKEAREFSCWVKAAFTLRWPGRSSLTHRADEAI
jgi:hypothetical protein